jgi:Nucleotidyl transferase AbiEii toxin, Type IV TA system
LFEREHQRRIARILEALDADKLLANRCLFGGGTALALRHGEYRESIDIDFMVSWREGYGQLRQWLTGAQGINAIARPGAALTQTREVRADQYGLRTLLRVDEVQIKFEIVLEGRITLDPPGHDDLLCGVATLTPLDAAASKLLAHADRWRDDATMSRDLIDLAMMLPTRALLRAAIDKAAAAYGASIEADLRKGIQHLRERPHRLDHCMKAMRIEGVSRALLWKRIKALEAMGSHA